MFRDLAWFKVSQVRFLCCLRFGFEAGSLLDQIKYQ